MPPPRFYRTTVLPSPSDGGHYSDFDCKVLDAEYMLLSKIVEILIADPGYVEQLLDLNIFIDALHSLGVDILDLS